MADRGKPLKFAIREQIKNLRQSMPLRKVAEAVGVAVNTARKYSAKGPARPRGEK